MLARHFRNRLFCLGLCSAVSVEGQGYDPKDSRMFASLASVTYCRSLDSVMDWTCGACKESTTRLVPGKIKVIDAGVANATRILVGKLRDQDGCLMAFRGSNNFENWIRDLQAWEILPTIFEDCDGCMVHRGFYDIWKNVRNSTMIALSDVGCSPAKNNKDNLLYVTGHSLGAALTHFSMFTLANAGYNVAKTYSFEAPRVGNKAFSDAFSSRFGRKFPVFRVTHHKDPVPHLPPQFLGYTHVQTEVYYNEKGAYKVCDAVEDATCADQYWNIPELLLYAGEHCSSSLVPNGDICDPPGCSSSAEVVV